MQKYICIILLTLCLGHAGAVDFTVNTEFDTIDDVPGDGFCEDPNQLCSLRAAIMEANHLPGLDRVFLPQAMTFTLTQPAPMPVDGESGGDLDITDDIVISAVNGEDLIGHFEQMPVIDGNDTHRVFEIWNTVDTAVFFSVHVTGGNAGPTGWGGAFAVAGISGDFVLENVKVSNNSAQSGGAIYSIANRTTVALSELSYNQMTSVASSTYTGPAIHKAAGELVIINSSIHHNGLAPGIDACRPAVDFFNTTAQARVINSVISSNGALEIDPPQCIDALRVQNGSVDIINSTFDGNGGRGLVFFDFEPDAFQFELFMRHSILANNTLADCGTITNGVINMGDANGGHNIVGDGSCALPVAAGNLNSTDPLLSRLVPGFAQSAHFLVNIPLPCSPAIDAGNPLAHDPGNRNTCEENDVRLLERPLNHNGGPQARCDIGAVELLDVIFASNFD